MKRVVTIRNKRGSDIQFGSRVIPKLGALHISYQEYAGIVKKGENVPMSGISVSFREVAYQNVSVKDFGARGDGVSDDTSQFQSAIDFVAGNGGGVVNVPVGVYIVSHLMVDGNVFIVGESNVDSVLRSRSDASAITFVNGENGMRTLRLVTA